MAPACSSPPPPSRCPAIAGWRDAGPSCRWSAASSMLVFGGLTIWLQDGIFIKLQPTIVNCLFGLILGADCWVLKRPLLKPNLRRGVPAHRRGLAQTHDPLGAVLLRAGDRPTNSSWRGFSTDIWIAKSRSWSAFPLTMVFALFELPLRGGTGWATTILSAKGWAARHPKVISLISLISGVARNRGRFS